MCRNFIAAALNNITAQTTKVSNFADRLHGLVHIVKRFSAAHANSPSELGMALGGKQKAMSTCFLHFLATAESMAYPARFPELICLLSQDASTAKKIKDELSLSLPLAVQEKGFRLADIYLCATRLTAHNQLPPSSSVGRY